MELLRGQYHSSNPNQSMEKNGLILCEASVIAVFSRASPVSDSVWNVKDSRLLPPKPSRSKPRPVYEGDVGAHLITVFGLQVRH